MSLCDVSLVTDTVEGLLFVTLITAMMKPFRSKMIDRKLKRQDSYIGDAIVKQTERIVENWSILLHC